MTKPKITYCDECRFANGWHFNEDGTQSWRPHLDEYRAKEHAQAIVEAAHEQQTVEARRIVETAATTKYEFSANDIRQEILDAGIDGEVVGAAFSYAAKTPTKDDGTGRPWIEATGRGVQSSDPATRHRINVWRSRIHPVARRAAS